MKLGVTLRNMGPQSSAQIMSDGAGLAEEMGFDSIWITDHIAIPPDDAEGSGGRYTDPLTTLAWLGGQTSRIHLDIRVLILPYREPLPTAKAIATTHELTGERLLLGCAVGWMDPEFKALGVNRHRRGAITDDTLAFLADCFDNEVVERNGQPFIFKPRPAAPPIYIGGSAQHALPRAVRFGHGWLPMARNLDKLASDIDTFGRLADEASVPRGPVTVMMGLPEDQTDAEAILTGLKNMKIERLVVACRYTDGAGYATELERLKPLLASL